MKAERIGRVLGIGLRVAGHVAGQHCNCPPHPGPAQRSAPATTAAAAKPPLISAAGAQIAGQVTRNATRGLRGFLRPFQRVGGILWLEITGSFYLLFSAVFAGYLWKQRLVWAAGQDHPKLIAEAAVAVVFLYLGLSAFWRAGRR
jgi:hypothetical protein